MYTKLVRSGTMVEEYSYERTPAPVISRISTKRRKRTSTMRRPDHIARLRNTFRRLVRANLQTESPPALLTLTMRDVVDIAEAYKFYTKFFVKFRRNYGASISWIGVPEFQKRGAVHFHVLVFGLDHEAYSNERRTRRIARLWGQGYVDIVPTDGSPRLSSYLAKYMGKAMSDERLVGKKAYSASRNLVRPQSFSSDCPIRLAWGMFKGEIEGVDKSLVEVREYDTMWLGRCTYKQYLIS